MHPQPTGLLENSLIPQPTSVKSQGFAADYIPGPQTHEAKHDTHPTRRLDSKNAGAPSSHRTRSARERETFNKAESIRKYLIQLEPEQIQMASKELRGLNREYVKLVKLASLHHSECDYPKLEDINQKLLGLSRFRQKLPETSQNRFQRLPMSPHDLQIGCLGMIAVVYEEQEKYDQASAVYEELYWLQEKVNGVPGSIHAGLKTKDRLTSLYWKQTPNLKITSRSTDWFTFHLRKE